MRIASMVTTRSSPGWAPSTHTGPAAGLTAVVAAQILSLGSFPAFLLAVVLAGLIQIGLGVAQAGFLAAFFPTSVIKGLLAAIGVILPFGLGWAVSAWLLPSAGAYVHAFVGATLTATSVGITARVLRDLHVSQTPEAQTRLRVADLEIDLLARTVRERTNELVNLTPSIQFGRTDR